MPHARGEQVARKTRETAAQGHGAHDDAVHANARIVGGVLAGIHGLGDAVQQLRRVVIAAEALQRHVIPVADGDEVHVAGREFVAMAIGVGGLLIVAQ